MYEFIGPWDMAFESMIPAFEWLKSIVINIVPGNGLLPIVSKPSPETMLTMVYDYL